MFPTVAEFATVRAIQCPVAAKFVATCAKLHQFRNCAFVLKLMMQWLEVGMGEASRRGNEGHLPTIGVHAHAADLPRVSDRRRASLYGTICLLSGIELRGDGGTNGSHESRGLKLIGSRRKALL